MEEAPRLRPINQSNSNPVAHLPHQTVIGAPIFEYEKGPVQGGIIVGILPIEPFKDFFFFRARFFKCFDL